MKPSKCLKKLWILGIVFILFTLMFSTCVWAGDILSINLSTDEYNPTNKLNSYVGTIYASLNGKSISADPEVKFHSSNPGVADIYSGDNGYRGVKSGNQYGETTITATYQNYPLENPIIVKVINPNLTPSSQPSGDIYKLDITKEGTLTIDGLGQHSPEGALKVNFWTNGTSAKDVSPYVKWNTIGWNTSNDSANIAWVEDKTCMPHSYKSPGTVTVKASYIDNGKEYTDTLIINVTGTSTDSGSGLTTASTDIPKSLETDFSQNLIEIVGKAKTGPVVKVYGVYTDGRKEVPIGQVKWCDPEYAAEKIAWIRDSDSVAFSTENYGTATVTGTYKGKYVYVKINVKESGTTTPSTGTSKIAITPNSGSINSGDTIKISTSDNSKVYCISYYWDEYIDETKTPTHPTYNTSSVNVPVQFTSGKHTLNVSAGGYNPGEIILNWEPHEFTIGSSTTPTTPTTTPTAPTTPANTSNTTKILVSPNKGTVNSGDTIKISTSDNSKLYCISYYWDEYIDDTKTPQHPSYNTSSVNVPVSFTSGKHTLNVSAGNNGAVILDWEPHEFTIGDSDEGTTTFTDVSKDSWAYSAIMAMSQKGIINGVGNSKFNPEGTITRAQFAKMMAKTLKLEKTTDSTFKDVQSGSTYYESIESVSKYLIGYRKSDGLYFRPDYPAMRIDLAYALVKALNLDKNRSVDTSTLSASFSDADQIPPALAKYALIAKDNDIMQGSKTGDGKIIFDPRGNLTRAQAAVLLYRISQKVSADNDGELVPAVD